MPLSSRTQTWDQPAARFNRSPSLSAARVGVLGWLQTAAKGPAGYVAPVADQIDPQLVTSPPHCEGEAAPKASIWLT